MKNLPWISMACLLVVFSFANSAASVPVTTDGEGLFQGILPAVHGSWTKVDVVAEHPTVRRSLEDVRIAEPNDQGISRLDIDLPSNKVSGEVTTDRGKNDFVRDHLLIDSGRGSGTTTDACRPEWAILVQRPPASHVLAPRDE